LISALLLKPWLADTPVKPREFFGKESERGELRDIGNAAERRTEQKRPIDA